MKKLFRKNQLIITALALMIAVAGYVSYTRANTDQETAGTYDISDSDQVAEIFSDTEDSSDTNTDETQKIKTDDQTKDESKTDNDSGEKTASKSDTKTDTKSDTASSESDKNPGDTVLTSGSDTANFAAQTKLNREQLRSKNKETLLEVINNKTITEAQKQDAIQKMIQMTDVAERENAAEILLEAKGFTNVVVSITDDSADVVLNMGDVTDAKRAQVEDIMKRKTGISAENIVITPVKK